MKIAVILLFIAANFFGCGFSSLDYKPELENENLTVSPTPTAVICLEKEYQPKTEAAIDSMTPRQLIDELVKVNIDSFATYTQAADYEDSIEKRIRKAGVNALPILTEYMNVYQPQSAGGCDKLRFDMVDRLSEDIDRFEFRLRGTPEGQQLIKTFELAIKRMENANIDQQKIDYKYNTLNHLKGITFIDNDIQDTFWVNKRVSISDAELLDFSNFLTERDPAYPLWSDKDFIKDYSRINEAGNPLQVYVLKNSERFYEAYAEFKKVKQ